MFTLLVALLFSGSLTAPLLADDPARNHLHSHGSVSHVYDVANRLQGGIVHSPGLDAPLLLLQDADRDGTLSLGEPRLRLLVDGVGSITMLLDDRSSTLLESYRYDSFGTPTILAPDGTVLAQSAVGNPYAFTGREVDPESGLYYFRRRYYDPRMERLLQEDPLRMHRLSSVGPLPMSVLPACPAIHEAGGGPVDE